MTEIPNINHFLFKLSKYRPQNLQIPNTDISYAPPNFTRNKANMQRTPGSQILIERKLKNCHVPVRKLGSTFPYLINLLQMKVWLVFSFSKQVIANRKAELCINWQGYITLIIGHPLVKKVFGKTNILVKKY